MSMTRQTAPFPTPREAAENESSWINKTPGVCGGSARVRNTRITVWGLVESRRLGASDGVLLEQVAGLTQKDLDLVWEYAAQHPDEVEEAIRENAEA